jgi:hypothetical protein
MRPIGRFAHQKVAVANCRADGAQSPPGDEVVRQGRSEA